MKLGIVVNTPNFIVFYPFLNTDKARWLGGFATFINL